MNVHCDALLVALLAALGMDRDSLTARHFFFSRERKFSLRDLLRASSGGMP